jgi:hypothetical protein
VAQRSVERAISRDGASLFGLTAGEETGGEFLRRLETHYRAFGIVGCLFELRDALTQRGKLRVGFRSPLEGANEASKEIPSRAENEQWKENREVREKYAHEFHRFALK